MSVRAKDRVSVLVYRLGSLGDTLLALPAMHVVRRELPDARITLLTNRPVHAKAPPMLAILENSGLVDDVIEYPIGLREWDSLTDLRRRITAGRFDLAVNLAASRGWVKGFRDYWFLRSCGIPRVVGTPWRVRDRECQEEPRSGLYEWEGKRIARRISRLASCDIDDPFLWSLNLTDDERAQASRVLAQGGIRGPFLAISVGTKVDVKDWTLPNWRALISSLAAQYPDYPLVAIGSDDEAARTDECLRLWNGPSVNLCGQLPVRVVGAVLARAAVFVGHDSGPMHLAATMGVPCVAIFAARNLPGQWYPRGRRNVVLYNKTSCFGCELEVCTAEAKRCIMTIPVGRVAAAVNQLLPRLATGGN